MNCKICGLENPEPNHFWTTHKIKQSHYYEKYEPKHDLLTGEKIKFKTVDQYISADFIDKKNLKKWIVIQDKNKALDYLIGKLKQYIFYKNLEFVPGQNELRTLSFLPIIDTFEFLANKDFNEICIENRLKTKYNYKICPEQKRKIKKIIRDTREQDFIQVSGVFEKVTCLKFGDYSETETSLCRIERKNESDARGSLSKGFERFRREFERAKEAGAYIVVLVESTLSNTFFRKTRFGAAQPEFLCHRMRELCRDFNTQFLFTGSREESARLIEKILSIGIDIKNFDLQYYLEKGVL